jgi:hypothetical protein
MIKNKFVESGLSGDATNAESTALASKNNGSAEFFQANQKRTFSASGASTILTQTVTPPANSILVIVATVKNAGNAGNYSYQIRQGTTVLKTFSVNGGFTIESAVHVVTDPPDVSTTWDLYVTSQVVHSGATFRLQFIQLTDTHEGSAKKQTWLMRG